MKLLVDILGWVGSFEVIAAYALNSYQFIRADTHVFQILNFTGGAFLIANTIYHHAYPSAFINIVWAIIAIAAIVRNAKAGKQWV